MKKASRDQELECGRAAMERRAWREAFENLATADRETPLAPDDLEQLAIAAQLTGQDTETVALWTRAHQGFLAANQPEAAARCAFWLALMLFFRGDAAQASGWLGRAQRLVDEGQRDSVLRGYLLVPVAIRHVHSRDFDAGHDLFARAGEIAGRFKDPNLMTFALHGQGRALVGRGEIARGVALLDEAMIAVTAGEVSPIIAGAIYCSLIETCHGIYDLRRADEWTTALAEWCASQPDMVLFHGECMVHRTQILELRGEWSEALDEAGRACDRLSHPSVQPEVGEAWYRKAEIHRLRGEFEQAEEAYRQASPWRKPQPGLALLRLAQGQLEAARAAIHRLVEEDWKGSDRSAVMSAYLEIALAAGDLAAARGASDELTAIAKRIDAPFLRAVAAHAKGAVSLAENEAPSALAALRASWNLWRELDVPYEMARVGVRIALACRALGDEETSRLELDAARRAFERLGAGPDLEGLERVLAPSGAPKAESPLTARELEVLRLVAAGKTNKAIGDQLFISEKTVARHLSNIFNKLDLSSRAAATAYAYQHRLV